jgi:hypothetical protein
MISLGLASDARRQGVADSIYPRGQDNQDRVSVSMMRVVTYGNARVMRWHGLAGHLSHFVWSEHDLPLCGEPISLKAQVDETGEITCPACCRRLVKRYWAGP